MSDSDIKELGGWSSDTVMKRQRSIRATERALAAYDVNNPFASL